MKNVISWVAQIISVVIMFQTLFFKFSGAEESVYIFSVLGMEPWGRIGTGVAELIACILLLLPHLAWLGAGMGLGLMSGAIFSHLTKLGIVVQNDGGQLFIYAIIVWVCSLLILFLHKEKIPFISRIFVKA